MRSTDSPHRHQGELLAAYVSRMSRGLVQSAMRWLDPPELDPERVHDLRVATKRLRGRWLLVAPVVGEEVSEAARVRLRDLARALAARRDGDVLTETLERLKDRVARRKGRKALKVVQGFQAATHTEADHPGGTVDEAILSGWQEELAVWTQGMPYAADAPVLREGLGRTYRKTRRLGRKAIKKPTDERLHEWRKWVKYLGYQLELVAPGPDLEKTRRGLARLGRVLGRHHDLHLVDAVLDGPVRRSHPKATRRARKEVRRERRRLEARAARLADHTLQASMTKFLAQVSNAAF